jgi:hypothetical protein
MATSTPNLGLTKPAQTEKYNVNVFNTNADLLDAAVSNLENTVDNVNDGYYVKAYKNTNNQSVPNAAYTDISLNAESGDTKGMHAGSDPSITIKKAGKYTIVASIVWENNSAGLRGIRLLQNGTQVIANQWPATSASTVQTISDTLDCALNDVIKLQGYQSSGGNIDVIFGQFTTFLKALKVAS